MSFHIAASSGEVAETVLLPGDPLRAKHIADNFLNETVCYNKVRGMYGYTGLLNGKKISVQGAGMGIPSTAIYVNELINEYEVKTIIRLGTCGSIRADIGLGKIILAMSACTDSNTNRLKFNGMDFAPTADFNLLNNANEIAQVSNLDVAIGGIFSTDLFYHDDPDRWKIWAEHGVLGVEMESSILYTLAIKANVGALSILYVSDNLITGEVSGAKDREVALDSAMKIIEKLMLM